MAVVFIPSLMQALTGGQEQVTVEGANLRQVINNLEAAYPGFKNRVLDESGQVQDGLAIAVDGSTSHLGLIEPVSETTEIHFIPAIGGG
jgi:molybdopterin synthase sulfur carrier subunit